ncbi:MAG TPA: hypothetical protein VGO56_19885 [Pyrinomonadaceae bacterium]|jgi:hypothetical protein|nr:hypothetical protein [Pyrinomonadaceae bacterium]
MSNRKLIIVSSVSVLVIAALLWIVVLISLKNRPSVSPIVANQQTPMLTTEPPAVPAATPTVSTYSLEYKLAVIDEGGYVDESDQRVARIRYLLSELERKTTNNRQQIAHITVSTQQKGREYYGKDIKVIDIMEGTNKAIPEGRKMDYGEVAAMVIVMLGQ